MRKIGLVTLVLAAVFTIYWLFAARGISWRLATVVAITVGLYAALLLVDYGRKRRKPSMVGEEQGRRLPKSVEQLVNRRVRMIPQSVVAALDQIGSAIGNGHPVTSALTNEAIEAIAAMPPQSISRSDRYLRIQIKPPSSPASGAFWVWSRTGGERRAILEALKKQPELAPIFLFDQDGHVREAALDSLEVLPPAPFFFAALAWRLNDWVKPVRDAAARAAERLFPSIAPDTVVGAAPLLLDRWRYWQRWEDSSASLIDRVINRPDVSPVLASRFAKATLGPLGRELRYALRGTGLDPHLTRLAGSARHPAVRATALRALIDGQASWPTGYRYEWMDKRYGLRRRVATVATRPLKRTPPGPLIRQGLRDRSAAVRIVAADALIKHRADFPGLDEVVRALGDDKSKAIRWRADFLVRKRADEVSADDHAP